MVNPITGLIQVSGEHDTGKSTFCLTSGYPLKRTAFIDDDEKGRATVEQLGKENFGYYVDLVEKCDGKKEIEQHQIIRSIINELAAAQFDVVVWDTWTRAGKSCFSYVKKFPREFKDSYSAMGSIKGAEEAAVSNTYEAELLGRLTRSAKLVFVTAHLKDQRKNLSDNRSVLTGKQEPDARRMIEEKANMRIWVRHNPTGIPIPIGLLLKRPTKWMLNEAGIPKPINFLPRRVNPLTWENIVAYWESPVGDRVPLSEEMPDAFELSILDGTLTPDQRVLYNAALKAIETDTVEAIVPVIDNHVFRAQELASEGKSQREIAKVLASEFAESVSVAQVVGWLNGSGK